MSIESALQMYMDQLPNSRVKDAMMYSLMAGGKRIRPNLLFEITKGYGRSMEEVMPLACALEMVHTYSLIHDDLPSMDNDDLRRGKLTCHKKFDEATAILAGDGLLTYAFEVISQSGLKKQVIAECVKILSSNAGPAGMVLGQTLDIKEGEMDVDWESLKHIHQLKTGCLLAAPCMMASIACDQDASVVAKWKQVGLTLGLAFQVQDDVMDVELSAEDFGKSNSDEKNHKVTSVTLLGKESAKQLLTSLYAQTIKDIQTFKGFDHTELLRFISKIETRTH